MKPLLHISIGVVVGFALAGAFRPNNSSCCARVAAGVRARATDAAGPLGGLVGGIGDTLGLWDISPGLLDAAGVPVNA